MADSLDIRSCDSEGGSGKSDLLDKIAHLEGVKDHEPICEMTLVDVYTMAGKF